MTTTAHDNATEIRTNVTWDEYVQLRDSHEGGPRMTYYDGTLIIMSPEYIHEGGAEQLSGIVRVVADAFDIEFASAGSTTFRREGHGPRKGKGKEPDSSFYLGGNEQLIRGKATIDLDIDPPPDLAIEVVNKSDSEYALPIYTVLRVPEVWFYDANDKTIWFGRLVGASYETNNRSLCLPVLTPALVLEALEAYDLGRGEMSWLRWLRGWASELAKRPPA